MGGSGSAAIQQVLTDLQNALSDPATTPEELQEKVAAVRRAREIAQARLEAARKELHLLLTEDQQAALIGLGYLD